MTETAISLTNVSKRFKLYHSLKTGPIKELLMPWRSAQFYREFPAVQDVTVRIAKGEIVGLIGANGAGKTTLLKIIAGLLDPDAGRVEVSGRVTALLALGVGVHQEFTGRENILYSGLLLGMSKSEILSRMEEIVDFAELGEFIDQPFRTYSSGMRARLLFAASMSIRPDILIIDEALATGDEYFVGKSQEKIRQICGSGATVLFVSHSIRQVSELCDRSIVLEKGRVAFDGATRHAVESYASLVHAAQERRLLRSEEHADTALGKGTREVVIRRAAILVRGKETLSVQIGEPAEFRFEYEAAAAIAGARLCVEVRSEKSPVTYAFLPSVMKEMNTGALANEPLSLPAGRGTIVVRLPPLQLGDGAYSCDVELYPADPAYRFSYETCYCYYPGFVRFQAIYNDARNFGKGTLAEIPVVGVEIITEQRGEAVAEMSREDAGGQLRAARP